jgi:hypothetical protein
VNTFQAKSLNSRRHVEGTGTLMKWVPKEGWGLIESSGRLFFAHADNFLSDCECGQVHKCQVAEGMQVQFEAVLGVKYTGRYATAFQIRVKA